MLLTLGIKPLWLRYLAMPATTRYGAARMAPQDVAVETPRGRAGPIDNGGFEANPAMHGVDHRNREYDN